MILYNSMHESECYEISFIKSLWYFLHPDYWRVMKYGKQIGYIKSNLIGKIEHEKISDNIC